MLYIHKTQMSKVNLFGVTCASRQSPIYSFPQVDMSQVDFLGVNVTSLTIYDSYLG